ncbi:MAG: hypothetical protein ACOCUI_04845 [bacterium]
MKLKLFSFAEKNYKILAAIFVIFVSIISIIWYISLSNKSDGFFISIFYAFLLFCISVYFDYMNRIIDEKYYSIKECYRYLNWIFRFIDDFREEEKTDSELMRSIIYMRTFTLRSKDDSIASGLFTLNFNDYQPPLAQNLDLCSFIEFDNRIFNEENEFLDLYNNLSKKFENIINSYARENGITKKKLEYSKSQIDFTSRRYDKWANIYFENPKLKDDELNNCVRKFVSRNKKELAKLEMLKNKISKEYSSFAKELNETITLIQDVYKKRLEYDYKEESKLFEEIYSIKKILNEINIELSDINENLNR